MATRIKPIESQNLGQRAHWELREALIEGRFRPGERVRLRDLAEEMGISVTPVREAVLQLVQEGALFMKSPRDIRVRELSVEEFLEIMEIREFLEGQAIERFAERATEQQLSELERLEERHMAAIGRGDYRTAITLDRRFMFTVFENADLPMYLEILDRLWLLARPTASLIYNDEGAAQVDLGNGQLLHRLEAGDVKGAVAVRRDDLDSSAKVIVNILESADRADAAAEG
jgi:DNA-binding GntR family transcriptional regulator